MRLFLDTSALAKLFVPEAGTDEMNAMKVREWRTIGLTPSVLQGARELLADHAGQHGLRTLDALQLASFGALLEDGPATFGCADTRLCSVAAACGHATFNPLAAR